MKLLPADYAVRNLGRSPARLAATVLGSALVVLLVLAAAAFVQGMLRSLSPPPGNRNVVLVRKGSEESFERSQVSAAAASQAMSAIRGVREANGVRFASPEVHYSAVLRESADSPRDLRAMIRGVSPAAFLVHPQVEITEGRAPRPGRNEMMAGALAPQKLGLPAERLAVGRALWLDGVEWTIVGRFDAPGTIMRSEIWTALTDLQTAARRDTVSCVVLTLAADAEFADVDAWAATRLDLELVALAESEYFAALQRFYRPVRGMVWATAALIALAGVLGGLNTLYAAFAARGRELGMLQCLGFRRTAILLSLVQESVVAASAGALLAAGLGWLLLDGAAVRFSMGVFELRIDSFALLAGLGSGLALGLVGAIPPAIHQLRRPIAAALKSN